MIFYKIIITRNAQVNNLRRCTHSKTICVRSTLNTICEIIIAPPVIMSLPSRKNPSPRNQHLQLRSNLWKFNGESCAGAFV